MGRLVVAGAVCIAVLAFAPAAWAVSDQFYPNTTADSTNPASTCLMGSVSPCSLRDAIAKAGGDVNDADVFLAAGGVYQLTLGSTIIVNGSLHTVRIDGDGATIDASGNGSTQFPMTGGTTNLDLEDVTLRGSPAMAFLTFEGTRNLTLGSVTFTGNTSNNAGPAGLDVRKVGTLMMSGDRFTGNHGDQNVFLAGADFQQVQNSATLNGVTFDHNQGDAFTAGFNNGPITFHNVAVLNNTGASDSFVSIDGGTAGASLDGVDVESNTTTSRGSPTLMLTGSFSQLNAVTLANNTTTTRGGGAELNLTGTATATNWTVSGNQAVTDATARVPVAGGLNVTGGTLRLNHATVAENSAAGNADDLHTAGTGSITVLNSIVAGSSASGAVPCAADGGAISSAGHNIDLGKSCGFTAAGDRSNTDPGIGPLTSSQQPNFRPLLYGSPAVDAADSLNCPAADVLGVARPQGLACDVGAVEAHVTNLAVALSPSATHLPVGGGQITYTLTVSNLSGVTPQNVQLTNTPPAGASVLTVSTSTGVCGVSSQVTCALGAVHRGADATITITAKLRAPGVNTDTAHVQSELPDLDMTNDTVQALTTVDQPIAAAQLRLSQLKISPRSFRVQKPRKRGGGATISYLANAAATTTLTFSRQTPGVLSKHRCLARHPARGKAGKHVRRCTALVNVGQITHADSQGRNSVHFSGRLSGRALTPGKYTVSAVARKRGFTTSSSVTAIFSIKR